MLTEAEFAAWLSKYGAAWEGRDPEAVMKIFTPDASYRETPYQDPLVGRPAIGEYWRIQAVERQRNVTFTSTVFAVTGDTGLARWNAKFDAPAMGQRVELDGVFRCRFREEGAERGLCYLLEEWWHFRELGPL